MCCGKSQPSQRPLPCWPRWLERSSDHSDLFEQLLENHDNSIGKLWQNASKEENILVLLFWPWVQNLLLGQYQSVSEQDHHLTRLKLDKTRHLKLMILRLLAPAATRLGMSIKTLHSLGRILAMLTLHEQNRLHVLSGGESTAKSVLKGGNLYESLLILKTRQLCTLDSFSNFEDLEVLWQQQMLRIDAVRKQEPTRKKKTLVPSKPVIKPTERRRRRAPSQKSLSRKRK